MPENDRVNAEELLKKRVEEKRKEVIEKWAKWGNEPNIQQIRNERQFGVFGVQEPQRIERIGKVEKMPPYPILTSIGVEIEIEDVQLESIPRNIREFWHLEHDASCEKYIYRKGNLFYAKNIDGSNKVKTGGELVSSVIDTEDKSYLRKIEELFQFLTENGESYNSFRAGTHIHVSFPVSTEILKNIVGLAAHLEQVFFYLGGMGYTFRGLNNNCTYCRPITKFGPSVVSNINTGKLSQVFSVESLLQAENVKDFFLRYGGIDKNNPPGKYNPMRYNWITLYPLLTKGTIEFRIFNKTLNPYYLFSVIEFCQEFAKFALRGGKDLEQNSIYDVHTKEFVLKTLLEFCGNAGMDYSTISILKKIVMNTPQIMLDKNYYWTHLRYTKFNKVEVMDLKYEHPVVKAERPNFVDIHNLE